MALAKSWEMRPAPAIPHRVGSNADIFQIFVQVSKKIIYNPYTSTQIFGAYSAITNPQIANPQIFMINPQIANPQISTKCYFTVFQKSLKSRLLKRIFVMLYKS